MNSCWFWKIDFYLFQILIATEKKFKFQNYFIQNFSSDNNNIFRYEPLTHLLDER